MRSPSCMSTTALMSTIFLVLFTGLLALPASAQTSAFTYQGELKEGGTGVDASAARFVFRLWDQPTDGERIGPENEIYPVTISEGTFTVLLDFSDAAFDGTARYLEIGVDISGGTNCTWLNPRQPVTPAPYALHALHGGDNPWEINDNIISYQTGRVGIGTDSPVSLLEVMVDDNETQDPQKPAISATMFDLGQGASYAVYGTLETPGGAAICGATTASTGDADGVLGWASTELGAGIEGYNSHPAGTSIYGRKNSAEGRAIVGRNQAGSGDAIAILGETNSPTGFGGYFLGRGYFSDRVGLGTTTPEAELDVAGTARVNGFTLGTSPQDGYVLTSDAIGNGTWQAPQSVGGFWQQGDGTDIYYTAGNVGVGTSSPQADLHVGGQVRATSVVATGSMETHSIKLDLGAQEGHFLMCGGPAGWAEWEPLPEAELSLPYDGSANSTSAAFQVTNGGNSAGSCAIRGVINNASSSSYAAAGVFDATGTNGHAITALNENGATIVAEHNGTTGYAVSGAGRNASGGGSFTCTSTDGIGVYAHTTGEQSHALYAEASGGGAAAYIEATHPTQGTGLIVKGSSLSARFYGNVAIYEHGTSNKVLELGKGLDYAEGFDVTEGADSDVPSGTVLVIDQQNPGRLTKCRQAYDRKVAGIVAGANGLGSGVRLGAGQFDHDVALAGRVYCNVIAIGDDIQPGELLTTSGEPGYAMEVLDHARAQGAILGKAMEPLAKGQRGQILVLVTLQ